MERRELITMKEVQRYKILQDVIDKRIKGVEAAKILGLSYVHISRIKTKLLKGGFESILKKSPSCPPNKKITEEMINEILNLRKKFYYDFNIMHFMDKLKEEHKIILSYERLRQILIQAGEDKPKKKKKVYRQRRRMPKAGMLVQMDSSQHQWLENIEEKWWLIAMIDDATNEVPYAYFSPSDNVFANMHVIRRFIEIKGLFMSLYVDKASHFTTTRDGGLHYNVSEEQEETQIERALKELDITLIPANSPQAKGRIEVRFRIFQDRLIKEMGLAGIRNYDEANKYLIEKFLPWHNKRYTLEVESAYMPLAKEKNLDLIFCIKEERKVNNDNTISINGQIVQIPPTKIKLSFAKTKVEVCLLEDKRIFVLYKNKIIAETIFSSNNKNIKKVKKIEQILNQREYFSDEDGFNHKRNIPSSNHPWRRCFAIWAKQKQLKKNKMEKGLLKNNEKNLENLFV